MIIELVPLVPIAAAGLGALSGVVGVAVTSLRRPTKKHLGSGPRSLVSAEEPSQASAQDGQIAIYRPASGEVAHIVDLNLDKFREIASAVSRGAEDAAMSALRAEAPPDAHLQVEKAEAPLLETPLEMKTG
ncbi:hypothetical protein BST27_04830 [Mycobacterium intermedium]|uniref:Uncharacterized protein n=1 Tax=Mycobacterium intermedium TaxID=28445 RepID=A0A1E3SMF8_MYCIE|nr:hypothetical protein [Mycobacterium intermedium]MCV6966982.1 hypothetical protein [Mycobacterium intermedium]ODR03301.1 hypothetical protein BHQ20_00155 [Mycobacterium intermedium]OPE50060.1 hypothetical protein BV508_11815 [Mycobacterium intermedium]ORB09682.1 hypothetical protein BST27_04830 [Mycobacterium intermedium]